MNNKTIIQLSYYMKNYGVLRGCYLPWPTASMDDTSISITRNLSNNQGRPGGGGGGIVEYQNT